MKVYKSKFKLRKLIHPVHLIALLVLTLYTVLSKLNMLNAISRDNIFYAFMQMFVFGTFFTYLFLYLFSHEKFFPFAKEIEDKNKQKEKSLLKKYLHHGKIAGTFLVGLVGGPIFLSLTIRFLLNKFKYRYIFIFITSFVSTALTYAISKGLFHILVNFV